MGLREGKFGEKLMSAICSAFLPAIAEVVFVWIWFSVWHLSSQSVWFAPYITISSALSMLLSYIIFYAVLPRIKYFRELRKYEGRWLQIIPDLKERPCAIIDFTYNKASLKYELIGFNFTKDLKSGVEFKAYKFVERTFRDGFYFITNQTSEHKNGLGKIAFIKSNRDNLTRAIGYFFDSSSDTCSIKYETILIKCDDRFFEHIGSQYKYVMTNRITPLEIAKISHDFVEDEIKMFYAAKTSHQIPKGNCNNCPLKNGNGGLGHEK